MRFEIFTGEKTKPMIVGQQSIVSVVTFGFQRWNETQPDLFLLFLEYLGSILAS